MAVTAGLVSQTACWAQQPVQTPQPAGSTSPAQAIPPVLTTVPASSAGAGQPMGAVETRDARVSGGLEVTGGVARLLNNASVTAGDAAAPVALNRGGHVLVCSTSEFHLLHAGANGGLIFGLDRGAVEIFSGSEAQDVVLTPDLRLKTLTGGQYDLRLRVTREGDTCVENHGTGAPVLEATDAFSSASYRVLPGQHVLFVGGDLHRVVDHETSSCGCPTGVPAMLTAGAHPFPEAESLGLATTAAPANVAPVGTASSQVSTSLRYGEGQPPPPDVAVVPITATAPAPAKGGFFHAIGHFFHRLFHGSKARKSVP